MGKRELMANFDDWVTDPHITLAGLKQDLLGDTAHVGGFYRGQYLVMTTSGSTGEPAVLVHDRNSLQVANLLAPIRARRTLLTAAEARAFLRRGLRAAALIADGDHFAGVVLTETARGRSRQIARRVRVFSVLRPLPELVARAQRVPTDRALRLPECHGATGCGTKVGTAQDPARPGGRFRGGPGGRRRDGDRSGPRLPCHCALPCLGGAGADLPVPAGAVPRQRRLAHRGAGGRELPSRPDRELSHTVLVTNLANRVQPLIRYNLGDRVQLATSPCACGSPFPAIRVEGRSGDVLAFGAAAGARSDGAAAGTGDGDRGDRRRPPVPGDPHGDAATAPCGSSSGRMRATATVRAAVDRTSGRVLRSPGRRRRRRPVFG